MLTRNEAWLLLCDWTPSEKLRMHAHAVELVMRDLASGLGQDVERFGLAGLLHDADYDRWPEEHPRRIVAWLQERGDEDLAHAISAHYTRWNVPYDSLLDKALLASDEITGFVMACALVRPTRTEGLEPKSVKKKLKDKAFAAKVDREIIRSSIEILDVDFDEHIRFVIDALKPHAQELGIAGKM